MSNQRQQPHSGNNRSLPTGPQGQHQLGTTTRAGNIELTRISGSNTGYYYQRKTTGQDRYHNSGTDASGNYVPPHRRLANGAIVPMASPAHFQLPSNEEIIKLCSLNETVVNGKKLYVSPKTTSGAFTLAEHFLYPSQYEMP